MDLVLVSLAAAGIDSLARKLVDPASNIAINVVSSQIFDPLCRSLRSAAARHIQEMGASLPRNHDVERAVRTAQLDASRVLTAAFARRAERLNRPSDQLFARNALAWIEKEAKAISRLEVDRALLDQLVAALDAPLTSDADFDAAAVRATYAAYGEMAAGTGDTAPNDFWILWASGSNSSPSWFAAFGDFLVEQIKTDDRFYRVVAAAGLAGTGAGVRRIEDMLAEHEPVWSALRLTADEILSGLNRVEHKIDAIHDEMAEIRTAVSQLVVNRGAGAFDEAALLSKIDRLRADGVLTARAIEGFLRDVGETPRPPEEWPAQLAAFADRFRALLTELSRPTNLPAELEAERTRASAAADRGDLDAAETILAALSVRLTNWRLAQQDSLNQMARNEAWILADRAAIAATRLRYQEAADLHGEAASIFPRDDIEARRGQLLARAHVLGLLGREFGKPAALRDAIDGLRTTVLPELSETEDPVEWALVQSELGKALVGLGRWRSETALLEEAITAYRAALRVQMRLGSVLDSAATQNNLGNALLALGRRRPEGVYLEEAVRAYHQALTVHTVEAHPIRWARTHNNLGNALLEIGRRDQDLNRLTDAAASFRRCLERRGRNLFPQNWARTQHNLGTALLAIGRHAAQPAALIEAEDAFALALQERTRNSVPLYWAQTIEQVARVCEARFELEGDPLRLSRATFGAHAALAVYQSEKADHLIADIEGLLDRLSPASPYPRSFVRSNLTFG